MLFGINTGQADADEAAQANNPLANMTAFNLQNYYIGEVTGIDENTNQFWLRYAKPTMGSVRIDDGAARALRDRGCGWAEIARTLNAEGHLRRGGNPWTRQTVWAVFDTHDARAELLRDA